MALSGRRHYGQLLMPYHGLAIVVCLCCLLVMGMSFSLWFSGSAETTNLPPAQPHAGNAQIGVTSTPALRTPSNWNIKYYEGASCYQAPLDGLCGAEIGSSEENLPTESIWKTWPSGRFSQSVWTARFEARINFQPGNYVFRGNANKTARVFIEGENSNNAIMESVENGQDKFRCPPLWLSGEKRIVVKFLHDGNIDDEHLRFDWSTNASPCGSQKPAAPSGLWAMAGSRTLMNLGWNDNSNNETGFRVYRNGSAVGTVGENVRDYQDNGLNCGTSYYYEVRAYNGDGESDPSNRADATTWECPGPTTPAAVPTTPVPVPTTPVPVPTTPVPVPTTPVPGPTTPVPVPTTPVPSGTPVITNIRASDDPINTQCCPSPNTTTIRADITAAAGIDRVQIEYWAPGHFPHTESL